MKNFHSYLDQETNRLVKKCGTFLTVRSTREYLVELYAVEDFFVEIWYRDQIEDVEIKTEIHKDIDFLDVYLEDEVSFLILKSQEDQE